MTTTADKLTPNQKAHRDIKRRIKFDKKTGCFIWTGSVNSEGYPIIMRSGKIRPLRRYIREEIKGPLPEGKRLPKWICGNRLCVNPNHESELE